MSAYVQLVRTLTPDQLALLDQVEQDIRRDEREGTYREAFMRGRELEAKLAADRDLRGHDYPSNP